MLFNHSSGEGEQDEGTTVERDGPLTVLWSNTDRLTPSTRCSNQCHKENQFELILSKRVREKDNQLVLHHLPLRNKNKSKPSGSEDNEPLDEAGSEDDESGNNDEGSGNEGSPSEKETDELDEEERQEAKEDSPPIPTVPEPHQRLLKKDESVFLQKELMRNLPCLLKNATWLGRKQSYLSLL
uniref:Uncharacterized protein n=1 Tax=Amphimedon queenslandica TaxID=400682 RepID=A0A1X7UM65_AMPQE